MDWDERTSIGEALSDRIFTNRQHLDEIKRLLARAPMIQGACELDLLVFLHRHPRTLLTNEQLAAFVGYDMKRVATAIDAFVDAGLLERTQNPKHAARMCLLLLDGSQGGGLKELVEVASTRPGRGDILQLLGPVQPETGVDVTQQKRRLHAIA